MSNNQRIVFIDLDDITDHELSTDEEPQQLSDDNRRSEDNKMSDSSDFEFQDYYDFPINKGIKQCENIDCSPPPKKKQKKKRKQKSTNVGHKPVKRPDFRLLKKHCESLEKVLDMCKTFENEIKSDSQTVGSIDKQNDCCETDPKVCLKDIDNDIKTDDKSDIKCNVEVKDEIKTEIKPKVEPTVATASTSIEEPENETEVRRKSDEIVLESIEMVDKSTDSRYYLRPTIPILTKEQTETSSEQTSTAVSSSATTEKIWIYRCYNCNLCLKSKKHFNSHYKKYHTKTDCPKGYTKFDKSLLKTKKKKFKIRPKKDRKRHHNSSRNPSTSVSKSHSLSKSQKSKTSGKAVAEANSSVSQNQVLTGQSSCAIATVGQTQYRVAQRCNICSFTPIVNSLTSIEEHIRKEHKHQTDIEKYHTIVMVKITPK